MPFRRRQAFLPGHEMAHARRPHGHPGVRKMRPRGWLVDGIRIRIKPQRPRARKLYFFWASEVGFTNIVKLIPCLSAHTRLPDAPMSSTPLDPSSSPAREAELVPDDVELMARCAKADHEAFAILVERHQHAVVGTIAKMMGSPVDAEDLAQQVFLRVWKSAPRYKPKAKIYHLAFHHYEEPRLQRKPPPLPPHRSLDGRH